MSSPSEQPPAPPEVGQPEPPLPSVTTHGGTTLSAGGGRRASERLADLASGAEEGMIAQQLRGAVGLVAILWTASFVLDALAAAGMAHVQLSSLLFARLLPVPIVVYIGAVVHRSHRVPIARAQRLLITTDVLMTLWLAWLALETGGLDSPLQTTLMFVPLSLAIVPVPWRLGLVRHTINTLTYLASMFFGHYVLRLGERETAEDDLLLFGIHVILTHAMSASLVMVSDKLYSLRREVFTSKNVGRYELRRLIGKGGMGEVWAAYHVNLRREVALKLVRVGENSGPELAARFEREVEAMTKLSHPNTVRIYDFGAEEGGLLYCAMELLEGEDLGTIVRREGPLDFERAHRILLQAASALAEAHAQGIVHRDIKPENLFVMRLAGEHEVVKVLDFGIAVIQEQVDARITHGDALTGTPLTMSPEAIRGEEVTPASDVYALGCVGYFMLAGQMPFGSLRTAALLNAHLHELPLPPSVKSGDPIPLGLEAIVMRALDKDPKRRFADAGKVADALLAVDISDLADRPRMSSVSMEPDRESRPSFLPAMTTLPGKSRRTLMDE